MIYTVILNYNNASDTIECINSLMKSEYMDFKILLVDNFSSDDSLDILNEYFQINFSSDYNKISDFNNINKSFDLKKINLIESKYNGGFSYGNNIGIKIALDTNDCEYVWLLNNDTEVPTDTLTTLVNYYRNSNKKIGVLGNLQYYYDRKNEVQAVAGGFDKYKANYWNIDSIKELDSGFSFIYGASMMMCKDFFIDVGLLCEDYFMYYEEIDIAERAKLNGYQLDICLDAKIYHKHGSTTSKKGKEFRLFYLERNKFLFYKKFYPHLLFIPFIKILKLILRSVIKDRDMTKVLFRALYFGGIKFEEKKNSTY